MIFGSFFINIIIINNTNLQFPLPTSLVLGSKSFIAARHLHAATPQRAVFKRILRSERYNNSRAVWDTRFGKKELSWPFTPHLDHTLSKALVCYKAHAPYLFLFVRIIYTKHYLALPGDAGASLCWVLHKDMDYQVITDKTNKEEEKQRQSRVGVTCPRSHTGSVTTLEIVPSVLCAGPRCREALPPHCEAAVAGTIIAYVCSTSVVDVLS